MEGNCLIENFHDRIFVNIENDSDDDNGYISGDTSNDSDSNMVVFGLLLVTHDNVIYITCIIVLYFERKANLSEAALQFVFKYIMV